MTRDSFVSMLDAMAVAWRARDYAAVTRHVANDVHYADPTRYALDSRATLQSFFENDDGHEQHVAWHLVLFDEVLQCGAAEYTYEGTHRYHGVVLVRVRDDLITHWREYQHIDGRAWAEFVGESAFPEQS